MRNQTAPVRIERKSADAHRVTLPDWSALGARIRRMALTATTLHLANRAEEKRDAVNVKG